MLDPSGLCGEGILEGLKSPVGYSNFRLDFVLAFASGRAAPVAMVIGAVLACLPYDE